MKFKWVKLFKRLAIVFGLFGCIGGLGISYLFSSAIIATSRTSSLKSIFFFSGLFLSWSITFVISMLLYAVGCIMEMLQSIDKKLIELCIADNKHNIDKNLKISNIPTEHDNIIFTYEENI